MSDPYPGRTRKAARPGQILIQSLLVLPSLILFIYLLLETTKISREKIRQQFAVDSAAFIQMGDYTNFLNRTAYVNGAFPYRIFRERYNASDPDNIINFDDDSNSTTLYDIIYSAGAFPRDQDDKSSAGDAKPMDDSPLWRIQFNNNSTYANNPDQAKEYGEKNLRDNVAGVPTGELHWDLAITTQLQGSFLKISWPGISGVYMFYAQVYSLLGSVEESQLTVFERLTNTFNFYRKSYYLNAGTQECLDSPGSCGEDAMRNNNGFNSPSNKIRRGNGGVLFHYVDKISFHAKVYTGGWPSPYYLGKTNPAMEMNKENPKGLFQLATVSDGVLNNLGQGLDVYQGYKAPPNYFNVDFNQYAACKETGRPCVHSRIATQCPQVGQSRFGGAGKNNCVWPYPTPKYQTRLYP